jgi:hypothetical protein
VLAEIDIQAKLKGKLGVSLEPYTIVDACNPPLANRGFAAEPELGTLLPCNVIVYEREGRTHVAALEQSFGVRRLGEEPGTEGVLASVRPMNAGEVRFLAEVAERFSVPLLALGGETAAEASRGEGKHPGPFRSYAPHAAPR